MVSYLLIERLEFKWRMNIKKPEPSQIAFHRYAQGAIMCCFYDFKRLFFLMHHCLPIA